MTTRQVNGIFPNQDSRRFVTPGPSNMIIFFIVRMIEMPALTVVLFEIVLCMVGGSKASEILKDIQKHKIMLVNWESLSQRMKQWNEIKQHPGPTPSSHSSTGNPPARHLVRISCHDPGSPPSCSVRKTGWTRCWTYLHVEGFCIMLLLLLLDVASLFDLACFLSDSYLWFAHPGLKCMSHHRQIFRVRVGGSCFFNFSDGFRK